MPRVALNSTRKIHTYTSGYPAEFEATPRNELFCKLCSVVLPHERKSSIEKHRSSSKHQQSLGRGSKQSLFSGDDLVRQRDFITKVADAFLCADIPLKKVNNPSLKKLFQTMGHTLPSESSCRMRVGHLAEVESQRVASLLAGKYIFLVVDEAEVGGKKFINTLAGDVLQPTKPYLVSSKICSGSIDRKVIVQNIDDCVRMLHTERENVVLLMSDAARYMTAAGEILQQLYPRLFHITCVAHLLHNCAEKVRTYFSDVDDLIACVKAATVRCKDRKECFREVGYPPQPVVTRWATWIKAALYYAEKLPEIRKIIDSFQEKGLLIKRVKAAASKKNLPTDLMVIKRDYQCLVDLLERCEGTNYTISKAYSDLQTISFGEDVVGVRVYLEKRLRKNTGLQDIMSLGRKDVSPTLYASLQECTATSVSVERSFSMLKKLIAKDRNFKDENIEKYIIKLYNASL